MTDQTPNKGKKAKPAAAPKVNLGDYKPWTPAELDQLSQITPDDIEIAKAAVKKAAPLAGRLLDAKEDDGNDQEQSSNK
jgi:hypothetical protein